MQFKKYPSTERGQTKIDWLDSYHSFSFGNFWNLDLMDFGALRVLNDDTILGGNGFPEHSHANMEIITIPLTGSLKHQDSSGGNGQIKTGDIQIMSAGTGIWHSEFNNSDTEPVTLLQIWITPHVHNIKPRYGQISYATKDLKNQIKTLVSPKADSPQTLWINQNAFLSLADLDQDSQVNYQLHSGQNGLFIFLISGNIQIQDQHVHSRDALGITEVKTDEQVQVQAKKPSKILFIEVPQK